MAKQKTETFKPVELKHSDGRTRTANSLAQVTQAEWDGFAPATSGDTKAAEKLETGTAAAAAAGQRAPRATT